MGKFIKDAAMVGAGLSMSVFVGCSLEADPTVVSSVTTGPKLSDFIGTDALTFPEGPRLDTFKGTCPTESDVDGVSAISPEEAAYMLRVHSGKTHLRPLVVVSDAYANTPLIEQDYMFGDTADSHLLTLMKVEVVYILDEPLEETGSGIVRVNGGNKLPDHSPFVGFCGTDAHDLEAFKNTPETPFDGSGFAYASDSMIAIIKPQ